MRREGLAADEIPEDEEGDLIDTNEDIPPDDDRDIDEEDKGTPDELDLDPDEETAPDPTPPEPPVTEWYAHKLLGPGNSYYKVECAASETEVQVRGLMTGERGTSAPLKVKRDGSRLYFNGDEVGRFKNDEMRLCTGEFEALCSVRYRESDGQLYIQFRDDDLRRVRGKSIAVSVVNGGIVLADNHLAFCPERGRGGCAALRAEDLCSVR